MPFFSVLKHFNHPSNARSPSADVTSNPLSENSDDTSRRRRESEPTRPLPQPWSLRRKAASAISRARSSPPTEPALVVIRKVKSSAPDAPGREIPIPVPLPAGPGVIVSDINMVPPMEMIPATTSPVPDMLAATWDQVKDGLKSESVGQSPGAPGALGNAIGTAKGIATPFTPVIKAAASAIGQSDIGMAVKEGIDHFFDGMPVFMSALDEVKSLHPFIGVVVLAFKTVYTLEQKRRDNEKKIIALYVEMKDMMGVLLLLGKVTNDKLVAPDGRSIKDRMKSIVERTAEDIKKCSSTCDTYAKKKLLAKVFRGPAWNEKLLHWVSVFSNRRQEFEFELSLHTGQGVDKANSKLDVIDEKINVLKAMFEQLVSPEQKQLAATVAANGGVKALKDDDKMLLELERTASKVISAPGAEGPRAPRAKPGDANPNADDLRKDIFEDPEVAVERNQIVFFRKFEAQQRQIIDELTLVVKRESDRVIQEIKGGPHERILDRTIHGIWTEMGWRGNVKARHFVLALRDHYIEKLATEAESLGEVVPSVGSIENSRNTDAWAIKFIEVTRLQPILEAFDDDASGFITISEMNRFTSSRPREWSLPHWIAFWAVGYKASIIEYANKIEELFAKMEGVRAEVLPPNRVSFDNYFISVWNYVHTLTVAVTPLVPELGTSNLVRFKSYLEAEEVRLGANLKAVDYVIDGTDTLTLLTGVGRIEKTIFPLIYLLMKRHYEVMRTMRTKVLDSCELRSAGESLSNVNEAIRYRMIDLTNIFIQQKLDPEKQFQNFAYGIFKYVFNAKDLWSLDYIRTLNPQVISYDDSNEDQNVRLGDILKHEYKDELAIDDWVYDGHSTEDTPNYGNVEPPLKDILGHWHGYSYEHDGDLEASGSYAMMTFVLEPADGKHKFKANAWSIRGRFTVTGSWSKGENDVMEIKLRLAFHGALWSVVFFTGRFDAERNALTGVWGLLPDAENSSGLMEFRRVPSRYLTVYPSLKEISDNKSRALWRFAIAAVRNDVRRERWSWSYFAQRRKDRETVISLGGRYFFNVGMPVSDEEARVCSAAAQRLSPADACFYMSKISRTLSFEQVHVNVWCDRCWGRIGGARLICLDCEPKDTGTFKTLDLCCTQECMAARVTYREDLKTAHEPSHRLVKVRTVVLERQFGRVHMAAIAASKRVQAFCARIAESQQRMEEKLEETGPNLEHPSSPKPTPEKTWFEQDDGRPGDDPDVTADIVDDFGGASQDPSGDNSQGRTQPRDSDPPSCDKCKGRLSFPCWYCTQCEDHLFLCDSCDGEGVPELIRSSGKHTEDHHLIRCLAPEKDDDTLSSTERRLISLEDQLHNLQSRFDGLTQDITIRIGNMEQLFHRLATAVITGSSV
ncbi:hypothetical protein EI94DRAFT_1795034 [Lactarius quietus]|nr:hypothetical protein EI94DRAFT_1795034 [Lactarius quietus]